MNTEGRQPIDGALSLVPTEFCPGVLERLPEETGLTWPRLAAGMAVADRGAIPLRRAGRSRTGAGQQGILALARDLPGGCGLGTGGSYACDQTGNPEHHGHGG